MALTQVSTDGVKNDAISHNKIPANAIQASELADNAVDTAAIANNAVTTVKIPDDAITAAKIANNNVGAQHIANGEVGTTELADDAVTAAKLANTAVTAASYGSSSAIPVITVDAQGRITAASTAATSSDLVADTSPQLGGDLASNGSDILLADNDFLKVGTGNDLTFSHNGTNSFIANNTGELQFQANDVRFYTSGASETHAKFINNGAVELYHDNTKRAYTTNVGLHVDSIVSVPDNGKFRCGAGDDLEIFSSGSIGHIKSNNDDLRLEASRLTVLNRAGNETLIDAYQDGGVSLYHNNSKKLETYASGILVSGAVIVNDNERVRFGNQQDLDILHNGSDAFIENDTGDLFITNTGGNSDDIFLKAADNISLRVQGDESGIEIYGNAGVALYHDNTQRFTTTNAGVGLVQTGDKLVWPASSGAGPEIYNLGSSTRDLGINIDNAHMYTLHQNGIIYQRGANSSNGGAYTSVQPSYPIRAWLSFNDEDNITNGHGGISSVSDTGTGYFTINYSTSFPDDNYVCVAMSGGQSGSRGDDTCITHGATNPGTGSIGIRTRKFTDNSHVNSESAMFLFLR